MAAWFAGDLARTGEDRYGYWFLYEKYTFRLYSGRGLTDRKLLILRELP
jgi:hypothetical protein